MKKYIKENSKRIYKNRLKSEVRYRCQIISIYTGEMDNE